MQKKIWSYTKKESQGNRDKGPAPLSLFTLLGGSHGIVVQMTFGKE